MRLLQSFDFRASAYERPNQKWVCGHRGEGEGCRLGPDTRGRCRTTAECTPRRDGALWVCTRAKRAGGRCAEGPGPNGECGRPVTPCQPVRSVRARRGLTVRWATAVTLGLLLVFFFGEDAATWISPGPLTGHHAEIESCATCHEDFGNGPTAWVHAALSGVEGPKAGDSRQCLSCHEPGAKPFNAHSLADTRFEEITLQDRSPRPQANATVPVALSVARENFTQPHKARNGALACADCHSEHQGASADIKAMSDQQCQVCHTQAFKSFTKGHPDIEGFAYPRRTRINFDHVGHMRKHFDDAENPPKQCTACHVTDETGGGMQTRGFAETCASCHTGDVRGAKASGSPGVPVLTVPGLDLITLREENVAIGAWPRTADRELSPFMRAMLADDAETQRALTRFRNLDTLDLRDASQRDLDAVKTVAWAVKGLLYDLVADGPSSLRPALGRAFEGEITTPTATRLVAGMPLDTLRAAQKEWFPDLASEIKAHRNGERVPIPTDEPAASSEGTSSGDDAGARGGTGTDEGDILAADDGGGSDDGGGDSILGGDDGGGSNGGGSDDGGGDSILGGDDGGGSDGGGSDDGGGDSILGGDDGGGSDGGGSDDGGGDSILGGDDAGGSDGGGSDDGGGDSILGGDDSGSSDGEGDGGILGGDDGGSDGDLLSGGGDRGDGGRETETAATKATMPEPEPGAWTKLGGWYQTYFAIVYRPRGHADPFLKTWLDQAGASYGASPAQVAEAVLDRLGTPKSPGRCVKCHSIDRTSGGRRINWTESKPAKVSQFTNFEHDPHLTQVRAEEGCATCHRFAPDNAYLASFDDLNPSTFASSFQPITTDTCARCHVDGKAGNTCTQCHNYHVGKARMSDVSTRMDDMSMKDATNADASK